MVGLIEGIDGTVNSYKYVRTLQDHLLPTIEWYYGAEQCTFMQDNARPHTSIPGGNLIR